MHLLALPPELRLQIYEHLPELQAGGGGGGSSSSSNSSGGPQHKAHMMSLSSALTPSISRASRVLRAETLPLYASSGDAVFVFEIDSGAQGLRSLHTWLAALGPANIARVRALQLSQYWGSLRVPERWQRYAGLYVRLQKQQQQQQQGDRLRTGGAVRSQEGWECGAGTFPTAHDPTEARFKRVQWLLGELKTELRCLRSLDDGHDNDNANIDVDDVESKNLSWADIDLVARFINAVAARDAKVRVPTTEIPHQLEWHIDREWETEIRAAVSNTTLTELHLN